MKIIGSRNVWHRVVGPTLAALAAVIAITGCQQVPVTLEGTLHIGTATAPAGVAVAVFADSDPSMVAETFTDEAGAYRFREDVLTPGTYRVRFGDGSWNAGATDWSAAAPVIIATSPATVLDATIIAPTGLISGTVSRRSARPVANATVTASPVGKPDMVVATTTTDAQGDYLLDGLSMTNLILHFTADGYAETWSGDAAVPSAATPLSSDGSSQLSGIDATLAPESAITGQLVGSSEGWTGAAVIAFDKTTGEVVGAADVQASGNLSIGGLPAGTYTIQVVDTTGTFRNEVVGSTSGEPVEGTGFAVTDGSTKNIGQLTVHGADCSPGSANSDLSGHDLAGKNLQNCDLHGADLHGVDLHGADLRGAELTSANVEHADLSGARLDGASFFVADLLGANLAGASVQQTNLRAANIQGTDFGDNTLSGIRSGGVVGTPARLPAGWTVAGGYLLGPGADVSGADFTGFDLSGLDLSRMNATLAKFTNAVLVGTNLENANLYGATVTGADLSGANLGGTTLVQVHSGGITGTPAVLPNGWAFVDGTLFGQWTTVTGANVDGADLSGADLAGITSGGLVGTPAALPAGWAFADGYLIGPAATVTGADIDGVDLSSTNLFNIRSGQLSGTPAALPPGWQLFNGYLVGPGANLANAQLPGLSASGIDLSHTNLMYSDLSGADLSDADLTGAHLAVSDLSNANLHGANLTDANIARATMSGTDLGGTTLLRVYSHQIIGTPGSLPAGSVLAKGYLVCPGADIVGADLSGADLSGLDLTGAHLQLADLTSTDLSGVDFSQADLTGVDLTGATVTGTVFTGATLDEVRASSLNGVPAALPAGWIVSDAALVPPNG